MDEHEACDSWVKWLLGHGRSGSKRKSQTHCISWISLHEKIEHGNSTFVYRDLARRKYFFIYILDTFFTFFFFLFCSFPLSVCSFKFSLLLIYFSACYWITNVNVGEWNKSWAWSVDILGYFRPELTTRHQLTIPTNREPRARVSLIKIMLLLFRGVCTRHAYIEIVYSRRIHRGCLTNAQRR